MEKKYKFITQANFSEKKINKYTNIWLQSLKKKSSLTTHTFEIFFLSKQTTIALLNQNYSHMTKIQNTSIPFQICGFDILGSAKTGSGKTIAFLIPIIEFVYTIKWVTYTGTAAIIIAPTRELSMQNYYVVKDLLKYHTFSHGIIMGGANRKTEIEKLKKNLVLLFATPGRLLDHLNNTKFLKIKNLQFLIIDEADRCLEIGFEEEIIEIINFLPKNRQTMLFSATQTKNVRNLANISFRKNPIYLGVDDKIENESNQDIEQGFVICKPEDRLILLLTLLKKNQKKKIITFFSSCKEVKFYYNLFKTLGLNIFELHGKQKQFRRTATFFNFCKIKEAILFCTDIAARGLDVPAVDWIIQFSSPLEPKEYIHRIGRTGRGLYGKGWTLLFILPSEIGFLKFLKTQKIKLKEYVFPKKNFFLLQKKIENLIEKNFFLKKLAKEALRGYLNSYLSYGLKEIFDSKKINLLLISKSFGLSSKI